MEKTEVSTKKVLTKKEKVISALLATACIYVVLFLLSLLVAALENSTGGIYSKEGLKTAMIVVAIISGIVWLKSGSLFIGFLSAIPMLLILGLCAVFWPVFAALSLIGSFMFAWPWGVLVTAVLIFVASLLKFTYSEYSYISRSSVTVTRNGQTRKRIRSVEIRSS